MSELQGLKMKDQNRQHLEIPEMSEKAQLGLQALIRAAEKVHAREAEGAEKLAKNAKRAKKAKAS